MDIKSEDFPLYDVLVQFNQAGSAQHVIDGMKNAQTGGPDEQYSMAIGLWQVATMANIEQMLPGATADVRQKTIDKCAEVFQELAGGGHSASQQMVDYLRGSSGPSLTP